MKIKIFDGFSLKSYQWKQFTKNCFTERGFQLKEARKIRKLSEKTLDMMNSYGWSETEIDFFHSTFAPIFGFYYGTISYHDSIQTLSLSGHALNAMNLLRPHLEALLLLVYILENRDDLIKMENKVYDYFDWVIVKMKINTDQSFKSELARIILTEDTMEKVKNNFNEIKSKYANNPKGFKKLLKMNSFLNSKERLRLSKKINIEGLYHHIYAESSAVIHFADIEHRMEASSEHLDGYTYDIRKKNAAVWPILISNLLQVNCIMQLSKIFHKEDITKQKLESIFNK